MNTLAALGELGLVQLILLGLLGLLIFGKRLPEVGKNLGKGIVEFKKGLTGVNDDINRASSTPPRYEDPMQIAPDQRMTMTNSEEALRAENARLRGQIAEKSETTVVTPPMSPEEQALRAENARLRAQLAEKSQNNT